MKNRTEVVDGRIVYLPPKEKDRKVTMCPNCGKKNTLERNQTIREGWCSECGAVLWDAKGNYFRGWR